MNIVNEKKQIIRDEAIRLKKEKRCEDCNTNKNEVQFFASDSDESVDLLDYYDDLSSASCRLDQVEAMIYGGFNSRFWMMRKHINMTPINKLENLPFYAWNCISLQFSNHQSRDVDLVIKSETQMKMIIKLLVYNLKTINGQKNTADPLLRKLLQRDVDNYMRDNHAKDVPKDILNRLTLENEFKVFN